jgi:hypothetical protein
MSEKQLSPDRKLLTEKEAAAEFRTSRQTLWALRNKKNGSLPYYRVGSAILYDRDELDSYFRRATFAAAA